MLHLHRTNRHVLYSYTQTAAKMVTNIYSMQISYSVFVCVDTVHMYLLFFVLFIHPSIYNYPVEYFRHIDSIKVCTLIKHSVTKVFSDIICSFITSLFSQSRNTYMNNILWYYQIRPKVVWKVVHGLIDAITRTKTRRTLPLRK